MKENIIKSILIEFNYLLNQTNKYKKDHMRDKNAKK